MAFMVHQTDDGRVPGIEYLPASAITPEVGMALYQSGGYLALAAGSTTPTYISMCQRESACTEGDIIPVLRVLPDMIFEAPASADMSSVNLGDKVTISTDGLQVTATTGGTAEVVYMDGTDEGDLIRVRFA